MNKIQALKSVHPVHLGLLILTGVVFLWSAYKPIELGTWFLEVTPVILGGILLIYTYKAFRFTTLVYSLLCLGAVIALIGGHYTYGKVPLFNWLNDYFTLGRNHYDRFAHLIHGMIWALTLRELLLRITPISRGKLLIALVLGLVLGLSAVYELVEWGVAILGGGAEAFLGLQGDIWDTQWDMFLAFIGGGTGLLSLSRVHNRFIERIDNQKLLD